MWAFPTNSRSGVVEYDSKRRRKLLQPGACIHRITYIVVLIEVRQQGSKPKSMSSPDRYANPETLGTVECQGAFQVEVLLVNLKRGINCTSESAACWVTLGCLVVSKVIDLPNQKKPIAQELVESMEEVDIDLVDSFIANFDDSCDLI